MKYPYRCIGLVALCECAFQSTTWIEGDAGHEPRDGRCHRARRHGGEGCAAAVRPALQRDALTQDVTAAAQPGERSISVERTHRHLVEFFRSVLVGETSKTLRMTAGTEPIDHQ